MKLRIVIIGLSITSSWGNGHATTYRALVKALVRRGHDVLFLEHDTPWYGANRDMPNPPFGQTRLYRDVGELKAGYRDEVERADLIIVGSYVDDGIAVGDWVTRVARNVAAFYDIDTPVTLSSLERRDCAYLTAALIPRYDLYLSFAGGPTLERIERQYGVPRARALCCSVDPDVHFPVATPVRWRLGYLGTYAADRQDTLETLLLDPARRLPDERFIVCGPQYPPSVHWPGNVERKEHLAPSRHAQFFASQSWTLNITRADMRNAGFAPSVRLFEAAACGAPIITDRWEGLETFFEPGVEIVAADSTEDVVDVLSRMGEAERRRIANAGRQAVLARHTATHRAVELERYAVEALDARLPMTPVTAMPVA